MEAQPQGPLQTVILDFKKIKNKKNTHISLLYHTTRPENLTLQAETPVTESSSIGRTEYLSRAVTFIITYLISGDKDKMHHIKHFTRTTFKLLEMSLDMLTHRRKVYFFNKFIVVEQVRLGLKAVVNLLITLKIARRGGIA